MSDESPTLSDDQPKPSPTETPDLVERPWGVKDEIRQRWCGWDDASAEEYDRQAPTKEEANHG